MRGNGRVISGALVSAGVCTALTLAGVSAAGPATAAPTARATGTVTPTGTRTGARGTVPVIIFLKNQWAEPGNGLHSGDWLALIQAAQAPYLKHLQSLGATDVLSYHVVNAIAARVPASSLPTLTASPGVASVIPDSPIMGPTPAATLAGPTPVKATTMKTPPGACSATPQLTPEALALTGTDSAVKNVATARSLGYTGAGVKVAFLADGIDPANANLVRDGKPVISDYKDFSGDGTNAPTAGGEAFLDANAIAGQGSGGYNAAGFGAQVPAAPCRIRIDGVAPGVSLVALKVFSHANVSTTSAFLQAIDYAVTVDHVNVLNESFGAAPFPDVTSLDAVKEFNDMAVRAGTTVVVAAGDAGPFTAIGSPASDPDVISVGASTDFQFYDQTDYAGADRFGPGGWESDNISSLSSGGYTQDGRTLDLVAPGDMAFAACTPAPQFSSCVNFLGQPSRVEVGGGGGQSAPLVAGAAALVIQAYAKEHHGLSPAPAVVKRILLSTATDLGAPATEQGAGLLNALKAVELAAWAPGRDPAGPTLELSSNQLNYVGSPGATVSWPVTVTNTAKTVQTVAVAGRGFGDGSVLKQASVTLSDAKGPQFTNWSGNASNYATVRFTVPRGAALLNTSIAWPASMSAARNASARVQVILVDPAGRLAAHSLPPGVGGYGSAQVLHPAAGAWTAVIFSNTAAAGGTTGTVQFGASVSREVGFGIVSPSKLSLAPGASGVVHVSARVPAGAGDTSGSFVFTSPASGAVSVPVTLRGQVPIGIRVSGKFSGVLTGGNGRSPGEGQVAAYSFVVPSGLPVMLRDIDVDVTLANDPDGEVSGYLVAPGGATMGYGSSYLTTGFNSAGVPVESPRRQLSLYASDPIPGTWTLIIDFTSPVPGNELSDPFTGQIRLNTLSLGRGALPDSPAVSLTRGKPVTYQVTVRNTGAAAEDIFLDPRLTTLQSYPLQPQDRVAGVQVPTPSTVNAPEWLVPTMTHSVSVSASAPAPVMLDFGPFPGDPDEASSSGLTASAEYPLAAGVTPVTQGLWFAVPSQVGPYPASGAAGTTVTSSMSAVTQQFDTSANSGPGDFWRFSVAPLAARASYNLFPVNPGQTRTINLTVTPSAPAGTAVHGVLYVDDFVDSLQFLSGSQLAALPYAYTIGLFIRLDDLDLDTVRTPMRQFVYPGRLPPLQAQGAGGRMSADETTASPVISADQQRLHELGYAQELRRHMSGFSNFAVSFTIISILSGCLTLYGTGMTDGGPVIITWGWPFVGIMTLFVGLSMAEVCSSFPTAGGLYYWSAKLAPANPAAWSWFTGWFNFLGQVAVTAGIDFGAAFFLNALLDLEWNFSTTAHWHTIVLFAAILVLHGVLNQFGVSLISVLSNVSVWWHIIGVLIIVGVLAFAPSHHQSASYVFTHFANGSGWGSKIYVLMLGLLLAQYTFTGYDASAHMTEETKDAAVAGPRGIVTSILVSLFAGWLLLIGITFAIQNYGNEVGATVPPAQIFIDAIGGTGAKLLLLIVIVAQLFCGMSSVTANSRMIYAFSRDGALPGSKLWHQVNPRTRTPTNAIWLAAGGALILGLPYLWNSTAYAAVTSIAVIGLYVAYVLPTFLRLRLGSSFQRGPWHLGRWSAPIGVIAVIWVVFITVLFMLPTFSPINFDNFNYTVFAVVAVIGFAGIWWLVSARKWFTGPKVQGSAAEMAAIEAELDSLA